MAPTTAFAQSTTTTTTTEAEAKTIWEKIKGSWTTTKGAVKEQWGKLTDDDLMEIEGRREQLVGKIQARYGIPREEAEAQVSGWERNYRSM
ncbi:MAG: CsbD family protein [Enhydrobacter sp.]|nr:MAG: CsbD family protein [Enhydrobacter sp.]